jgi:Na+/H+-dicarboxylate symporter
MKSTFKLLFALLLALGLGVVTSTANSAFLQRLANYVEPLGSVWIGFLKMVIIPLLISLLVTSVASKGTHEQTTPLLKRILLVFVGLYIVTLLVSMLIVPILLQLLPSSFTLAGNEGDAASLASGKPLSFIDQLLGWVPENPFKSAAEGAILPVVIFSLFFGLALNHVAEAGRNTVLDFFRGVGDAMLKIVEWLLVVAPLGIFCIVFPLTSRAGAQMVGALGIYVFIHLAMYAICIVLLYVLASSAGKTLLLKFMKACVQPQLIAIGTQSSIATLPAMVTAAEQRLGLSDKVSDAVLPLAVSVFRAGSAVNSVIYALFIARLYHLEFSTLQLVTLFVVAFAAAVSGTGLPSGASFFAPVLTLFTALGLPVQAIPILFAMDTIPDIGVTATNVTADMAAVNIIGKDSHLQHQGNLNEEIGVQEIIDGA